MDAHVKDCAHERLKGSQVNESVWDWIVRKTGIRPTISGIDELAKAYSVNRNTLRKLKKTQQCSMTEHTRKQLAKYSFKIPGVEKTCYLDDYGYSSQEKFVDPSSLPKDVTNNTSNLEGETRRPDQKQRLSSDQEAFNEKINSDFNYIIRLSKTIFGKCQFCEPTDFDLKPDVKTSSKNCKIVHLSTHKNKRYGPASAYAGKGFELEVMICDKCLEKYRTNFLLPVNSLVQKIMHSYQLSQNELAEELKQPGGTAKISRLLNNKIDFINPDFLRKLYGIYLLGPDIHYFREEHLRLLMLTVDHHAGLISQEVMLDKMGLEPSPWESNPDFLLNGDFVSEGLIPEPEKYIEYQYYPGGADLEVEIRSSELTDLYFDSTKVALEYEVEYEVIVITSRPEIEERLLDEGRLKINSLLIDKKSRQISEFSLI